MSITILSQSLRRLFRASNCPRDQLLAAYADQQLIGNERHLVEEHLTSCDACMGQVAFLVRSESAPPSHTPDDILRTALNHRGSRGSTPGYSWRWLATASAVAAIAGVALFVTWQRSQMLASRSNSASRSTEVSSSREIPLHPGDQIRDDKMRGDDEVSDSTLISPSPNATIDARNVEFRWKARQDASFYEIELVSESGDLIWQGRSNALSMTLPAQIHLESGKGYYVWIRTHMAHGAVEQSRAVRFTVS